MLPLFHIRWPLPPATLRMLFWVPLWGSWISALSERQWIYVQQLNCEHIRRLRPRLPVSTAVKCAGKSVVMSPYLKDITVMSSDGCVLFFKTLAKRIVSRDPASLSKMMRTPNSGYSESYKEKRTCFDRLLCGVCKIMTYNFMDGRRIWKILALGLAA